MSEVNAIVSNAEPLLIVISGPSGVGKDSVINGMKARHLPIHFVVTATTRPPRPDEKHGRDYFFYSQDEFLAMIEKGELLEYAIVYDDYKGIPKAQVKDALLSCKDVVMRLDVQGAATIRRLFPEALMIFLTVGDEEEIIKRLRQRKTETPEALKVRITTAHHEMAQMKSFDYLVINHEEQLEETVDTIISIIVAEHHRVNQRKISL